MDTVTHTTTSDNGDPASWNQTLAPGATFSFTFTKPGTYTYHCAIHAFMTGTIIVTA
jgi:plastocyanin